MKNFFAVFLALLSLDALSQIPDYVPTDGLVAWYPFDQNFQDESEFGNDAVENGSVPFTDDRFQNGESALSFSGNGNNFLRVNYSSDSYTFESGFSASVWFISNTTSGNRRVFSMGSTDASGKGFHVMKYSNEIGAWFCEGPGDPYFGNWDGNENTTFDIGEWNHLLFSCDFGNLNWTVFLNGDSVNGGTSGFDFDPNQLPVIFTQTFEIGRKSGTSNSGDAWNGVIDDLGIWSRPLTALEAEALYLSFNGIGGCTDPTGCNYDASANWNDGTCVPSGCMDTQACNYNADAECEGEACDYTCCPGPGCCDAGTVWSWESQTCVVATPAYLNEPGEAAVLNPCYFDSNGNGLVEVTDLMNVLSVYGLACGDVPAAAEFSCGNPLSYQGYDYETVQIGEQCWFAENARYLPSVSPSDLGSEDDGLPHAYVYGNESSDVADAKASENYSVFGALYNYIALSSWQLCPNGWHVANDMDFVTLEQFAGMSNEQVQLEGGTWRGTDEGYKLKSLDNNDIWWYSGGGSGIDGGGSDEFGFKALPGGARLSTPPGPYRTIHTNFNIWTPPYARSLAANEVTIWRRALGDNIVEEDACSVRCIKDAE